MTINPSLDVDNIMKSWWRHQMETFLALLALCAGNSPVIDEFPSQRPVAWRFQDFVDLRPNKRLSEQWCVWGVEMPLRSLWRHCDDKYRSYALYTTSTSIGYNPSQRLNHAVFTSRCYMELYWITQVISNELSSAPLCDVKWPTGWYDEI